MTEISEYPSGTIRLPCSGDQLAGPADTYPPDTKASDAASEAEFISIPEWARRLGISAESAYKAARLGQIPGCFNIGRLYRVNLARLRRGLLVMRSGSGEP